MKQAKVLVVLGAVALANFAQAQSHSPVITTKPVFLRAPHAKDMVREIQMRHVAAAVMAHWLEPQNAPNSRADVASLENWISSGYDEEDAPQLRPVLTITLPEGVYITQYSNEKNTLELAGSLDALQRAETLIRQIDQPFKQVEVKAQLVLVDNATLRNARLAFSPDGKTLSGQPLQQAKVEWNTAVVLQKWMDEKKAVVPTAPRIIALSGLAVRLHSLTITTGGFDYITGKEKHPFNGNVAGMKNLPSLVESFGLTAVPTVQTDGSIKARVQLSRNFLLSFIKYKPISDNDRHYDLDEIAKQDQHFLRYAEGVDKTITLKAGETLAFTGFDTNLFLGTTVSKEESRRRRGKTLVAFISMQPVTHYGEIAALPAN